MIEPSPWIIYRLQRLSGSNLCAIDIASGSGRHSFALLENHYSVTAVDWNANSGRVFAGSEINFRCLNLEDSKWPLSNEVYDLVLVSNYLYRPFLSEIADLIKPGGYLIYETFGIGNEIFGKPSNPDFLLRPKELSMHFRNTLQVIEDELVMTSDPKAVRVRYFALKPLAN